MKNTALIYFTAALVALAPCSCGTTQPVAESGTQAAACPLPQETQNALQNCAGMQWQVRRCGMHSKPSYDRFPVEADDVAAIKDMLLHRLHTAPSRQTQGSLTRERFSAQLCLLDGNGKNLSTLLLCHFAPESDVRKGCPLTDARYYLDDEGFTTFNRLLLKAQGITMNPQGNAPTREELIRRYNLGSKQSTGQNLLISTYQLVSGKQLMDSHASILDELDIQTDKNYGLAHVYKPRSEPSTGGGTLTVIYDPETGAILYAKKSR